MKHPTARSRYELLPGLLLGFHGADQEVVDKVLAGKDHLQPSKNPYDWLGHGIYFWEYSPQRALEFAQQGKHETRVTRGKIKHPAVIGAVIDPGVCLNLLESSALEQIRLAHGIVQLLADPVPKNSGGADLRTRYLDCAVIEMLHRIREPTGTLSHFAPRATPYDTVRGAFFEGQPIYPDAGFKEKSHVQICVRNTDCIKGYFRVMD